MSTHQEIAGERGAEKSADALVTHIFKVRVSVKAIPPPSTDLETAHDLLSCAQAQLLPSIARSRPQGHLGGT